MVYSRLASGASAAQRRIQRIRELPSGACCQHRAQQRRTWVHVQRESGVLCCEPASYTRGEINQQVKGQSRIGQVSASNVLNTRKIPAIFTRLNLMVKRVMMCARACVCTRCLAERTCTCVFGKCLQRPWCRNWDTPPPSVETERVSSTQLHAGQ